MWSYSNIPIIIDNGSYQCKAGWSNENQPNLIFKNLIVRPRKDKGRKEIECQIGNEITNIESVRLQLKSQFDKNVVTHFEAQEQIFDYTFSKLGISSYNCVDYPIILTEAFLNPNYSRNLMTELLFECYQIPYLSYGVDALFSFNHSNSENTTGLIINCGYHTTHIIPVIKGKVQYDFCKRINLGGYHLTYYMLKLLQLKYPAHCPIITPSKVENLLHDESYFANDYQSAIKQWMDPDYYENKVFRIQLPYSSVTSHTLNPEQQKDRRKELARRLFEINARKREEKLAETEEQLNTLLGIQDMMEEGELEEYQQSLQTYKLKDFDALQKKIKQQEGKIELIKRKIAAANANEGSLDDIKPKSKNKIKPVGDQEFNTWIQDLREKRRSLLEKRTAKLQRRKDMAKRRTAAAQERMRIISQLARNEKTDDNFGIRDEDWDVYKVINKEAGDSDSDEDQKLLEYEDLLKQHDPDYESLHSPDSSSNPDTHQLHVGIERLRAPEIIFQPSLIGSYEGGLAECIEFVLKYFDTKTQNSLVENIFLTGGYSRLPGLKERLEKELLEMRPFNSSFKVRVAVEPSLDAWFGAKDFVENSNPIDHYISKQEYLENGVDFYKEHSSSNLYNPVDLIDIHDTEVIIPKIKSSKRDPIMVISSETQDYEDEEEFEDEEGENEGEIGDDEISFEEDDVQLGDSELDIVIDDDEIINNDSSYQIYEEQETSEIDERELTVFETDKFDIDIQESELPIYDAEGEEMSIEVVQEEDNSNDYYKNQDLERLQIDGPIEMTFDEDGIEMHFSEEQIEMTFENELNMEVDNIHSQEIHKGDFIECKDIIDAPFIEEVELKNSIDLQLDDPNDFDEEEEEEVEEEIIDDKSIIDCKSIQIKSSQMTFPVEEIDLNREIILKRNSQISLPIVDSLDMKVEGEEIEIDLNLFGSELIVD